MKLNAFIGGKIIYNLTHKGKFIYILYKTCTFINSKWIKDLNASPDTIKLLEEYVGRTFFDINHSKIFFDLPPRVMKIKINKWNLIKLKSFCTAKQTMGTKKKQPLEWEKIFANETADKRLISKTYKHLMKFNIKIIKIWMKDLNRHFPEEDRWPKST